jgi:D-sedoheptulose 7-phosphate isomerase
MRHPHMRITQMDSLRSLIEEELRESHAAITRLSQERALHSAILNAGEALVSAYRNGKRALVAGNGGSAADAQHIAAEFVSRLKFDRDPLPAIALTADSSIVTAIGNDYGFAELFSRQVRAHGRPGDVFIGLTTSGRSENILRALSAAREAKMVTITLCGEPGLANDAASDHLLACPSSVTARIQECHIVVAHILCDIVERSLFRRI